MTRFCQGFVAVARSKKGVASIQNLYRRDARGGGFGRERARAAGRPDSSGRSFLFRDDRHRSRRASALRINRVISSGCEISERWLAFTSMVWAPPDSKPDAGTAAIRVASKKSRKRRGNFQIEALCPGCVWRARDHPPTNTVSKPACSTISAVNTS